MKALFALVIVFFSSNLAFASKTDLYKKIFPVWDEIKQLKIEDPISDEPVNTSVLIFVKGKKVLGYAREVTTSTGCNSACLPVIFTLFYDEKKLFVKVLSRPGLTKKNHVPFSELDYFKLEEILRKNPKSFLKVKHPLELVDVITTETKKEFVPDVVKEAAYSSLRINLYNQHTLAFLSKLK